MTGTANRLAAACVAGFLTATSGQAAEITGTGMKIGNWYTAAYTDDATGEFKHCGAAAAYKNGTTLAFAITRDRQWSMGLADDRWELTEGDSYPIRYRIDRGPEISGMASVVSQKQVRIPLPGNDRLFERFRRGSALIVFAANRTMTFSLTSTSRMLAALFGCAEYWRDHALKPDVNPFAGGGGDNNPFAD